ncbi:glycosyl transferase family 1 [Sphingomonas oleivorans]|uniref:Glycosyl transferase family 1 n=1 Tax=Sphingomonas oleivorans TaxID=1735121 RepID=A0A2T5G242_9SPHN|nr:glycosyltransferase [Sphingomonas oleivorans]PTQ13217.1 glycosyl transferase family 1 [Sphingomonas oleivorans]
MGLTVVSVSYPFAPVTADPVGGSEQVLAQIDRALVAAGHRAIIIAPEGSAAAGELRSIPAISSPVSDIARRRAHVSVRERIAEAIDRDRPDVIHLHGLDFHSYLPPPGPAVIATLHLPLDWYAPEALRPERPNMVLHPVSESQERQAPAGAILSPPIENGVEIPEIQVRKGQFAFTLGRICPEKGFEDAIEAAGRAEMPLLIAGSVFPYPEHQTYFRTRIQPRLNQTRRWIGAVAGRRKKMLLARARCLLVPSKVAETSSLVAMEAMAAGTPVIAYRTGALPDIVEHGRTGFIVDTVEEMSAAMRKTDRIDPEECRARARARFPLEKMTGAYLARYAELAIR